MAAFASFFSCSSASSPPLSLRRLVLPSVSFSVSNPWRNLKFSRLGIRVLASSAPSSSSDWEFSVGHENSMPKNSDLFNVIRDIEPLDVSLIQKDVPLTTIDAMKRTISGMLGLLPSDQFQVTIEALWGPLFKLLISSMMTGYTLRNAEYRLILERNLEINVDYKDRNTKYAKLDSGGTHLKDKGSGNDEKESLPASDGTGEMTYNIPDFGEMTTEAKQYILELHSRLSSVKKELHEVKRTNAALQMQQFVGEEKNDLLDYLRSLPPEKVVELSEPTSPELDDIIHSVAHGLLATLSPKMYSKSPDPSQNSTVGSVDSESEGDCIDLVENTSLNFRPIISLQRDYLARLLFWCMLLGHYLRGLEYRLELMDLLSLPCAEKN